MGAVASGDTDRLSGAAMAERLLAFVAEQTGCDPDSLSIDELRRLAGGASRELWSFELTGLDASPKARRLVLRCDPPGRVGDSSDRTLEFRLLAAAGEAGVPVPTVHWSCADASLLGSPFFVMDFVEGETIPRRLLRDPEYEAARATMTGQLGAIAARIHAIDAHRAGLEALGVANQPAGKGAPSPRQQVEGLAAAIAELATEPHPVLDLATRWLLERAPAGGRQALVHGDYRIGNVIFGPEGVRSILDWELAHLGDPVEDLGWMCVQSWRYGSELPAGGIGTREALVEAYQAAGGDAVDPDVLAFWEACGNFKVALVWLTQVRVFLDGRLTNVELAALGRRTAEPEAELLRIMESAS